MDHNLKLYLPFDEPDGTTAADFSASRNDATLSQGAELTKDAKIGKALSLNGGIAQTNYNVPYGSDFSIFCFVRPVTSQIGWILNFSGLNNYQEQWLDVREGQWYGLAFVRSGRTFSVYMDGRVVYSQSKDGTPVGFSLNEPGNFESHVLLDEVRIYDRAITALEILRLCQDTDVEYYINSVNFKDYGVEVSKSTGLVGQLEKKEGLTVSWDAYHGKVRDKKNPRFKERKITLECFIEAQSRTDFVSKVNAFFAQFDGSGTQRLRVEYDGTARPLVYEVYQSKGVDPSKTWGHFNNELMVGTFKLELDEDEPVKRVLRHVAAQAGSSVSFGFSSYKLLNVYWGDGTHTFGLSGQNQTSSHSYTEAGEYDIIITGVIEDITDFTTDAIVIWNKLK